MIGVPFHVIISAGTSSQSKENSKSLWAYKYCWQSRPPFSSSVLSTRFLSLILFKQQLWPLPLWSIDWFHFSYPRILFFPFKKIFHFNFSFSPFHFSLDQKDEIFHTRIHTLSKRLPFTLPMADWWVCSFSSGCEWVGVCVCATSLIKKRKRQKDPQPPNNSNYTQTAQPPNTTHTEKKREVVYTVCCVCILGAPFACKWRSSSSLSITVISSPDASTMMSLSARRSVYSRSSSQGQDREGPKEIWK